MSTLPLIVGTFHNRALEDFLNAHIDLVFNGLRKR